MNALADLLLGVSTLLICFNEFSRASWNSNKVPIFYRSSRPEVFYKKGVLRNLANFTGKHLCQTFFFNKVAGDGLQLYWKKTLGQAFSCEICEISKNAFFYRIPPAAASVFRFFLYFSLCKSKLFLMTVAMIFRIEQYDNCS